MGSTLNFHKGLKLLYEKLKIVIISTVFHNGDCDKFLQSLKKSRIFAIRTKQVCVKCKRNVNIMS